MMTENNDNNNASVCIRRDSKASYSKHVHPFWQERDASIFAMELLMPMQLFIDKWNELKKFHEDIKIKRMSNLFWVPKDAIICRAYDLGLIATM